LVNLYGKPQVASQQLELTEQLLTWAIRTSDSVPLDADPRDFPAKVIA
jgi:hypothetical protein